jgi:hypothetical protein
MLVIPFFAGLNDLALSAAVTQPPRSFKLIIADDVSRNAPVL